jgi:hypothetical protein
MGVNEGTLQIIGRQLGQALALLEGELADGGLQDLLAELGLRLPTELATADALVTAAESAAAEAAGLGPRLEDLATAVEADDLVAVLAATAQVVEAIAATVAALDALGDALHAVTATATVLSPAQRAQIDAFASILPGRLLDHLVVRRLAEAAPEALAMLDLAGLIDHTPVQAAPGDPLSIAHTRSELHLDRLGQLLSAPADHLRDVYGWGEPTFDGLKLFQRLQRALLATGQVSAILLQPPGEPPALEAYILGFRVDDTVSPPQIAFSVRFPGTQTFTGTYPLPAPWLIEVVAKGAFVEDLAGRITPPFDVSLTPPTPTATVEADVQAGLVAAPGADDPPMVLLGAPGGTRLQAGRVALRAGFAVDWDGATGRATGEPTLALELVDGRLVLSLGGADGFLASVLPQTLEAAAAVDATWRPSTGLVFHGGAALGVTIPVDLQLGPAHVAQVNLVLTVDSTALVLAAGLTGDVTLGPFAVVAQGVGAAIALRFQRGNLGPADLGFRFVPPTGLGLSIDAGPGITGGGFIGFDEPTGRYSGQLQLSLGTIAVDAVGLLDTRLPGGAQGFSLLVLLRASFPPVQVGLGFALSSVGGLLALNRRVDVDALRSRMASGTAGRILAPEDPVRNAPMLLSDLAAVFPPAQGVVVVGPTLQLFWVDLVRFDVGLFFELPGPTKVVVLGSARAIIENPSGGRPYLQLRLDILGVADLAKQTLEFDAVLLDSNLLEILELTGGAAFRLSTGAEPYLVLTVGGFHPAYSPAPLVFPASLTRVAMTRGTPTDDLYFRFEGYFAVTTNSLQFGASVEVIVNAGSFNIRGFLGFDALIRFQPFHFSFTISASVKVRWKGRTLAGLELRGELSGPGPVVFRGKVCIELLFFDICFEETFTLGSLLGPVVTAIASAVAELLAELVDPANLRAAGAADPFVAVAPAEAGTSLPVVSPVGQLAWSQERAPLDLLLQRFEGAPLNSPETVSATGPQVTGPDEDWFAPGGFAELSDADALNRRAFERLHGGVRLGVAGTDDGPSAEIPVEVKQIRIPAPPVVLVAAVLPAWVLRAAAGRAGTIERDPVVPALGVRSEAWVLRGGDGAVLTGDLSQAQAHQLATVAAAGTAVARADTVAAFAF